MKNLSHSEKAWKKRTMFTHYLAVVCLLTAPEQLSKHSNLDRSRASVSVAMILCCLTLIRGWHAAVTTYHQKNDLGWPPLHAVYNLQISSFTLHGTMARKYNHTTMTNFCYSWPLTFSHNVVPDIMVVVSLHDFQFAQRREPLCLLTTPEQLSKHSNTEAMYLLPWYFVAWH